MLKVEDRLVTDLTKMKKEIGPNQQRINAMFRQSEGFGQDLKYLKDDLVVRDQRLHEIETQFVEFQDKINCLFQEKILGINQEIQKIDEKVFESKNEVAQCKTYFMKAKEQFHDID